MKYKQNDTEIYSMQPIMILDKPIVDISRSVFEVRVVEALGEVQLL